VVEQQAACELYDATNFGLCYLNHHFAKAGIWDDYQHHGKGCNILLSDGHVKFIKGYNFITNSGIHE